MHKQIYLNIPVKDLPRSKAFFEALGYSFNPQFTNEQGACMVMSDTIYVMLLTEEFFQTFTKKAVAQPKQVTGHIACLSCESEAEVDSLVAKAVAAGGAAKGEALDHGFMYYHGFEDLDGHLWEVMYPREG
jgi:predicted lactoylglutathione lyase